MATIPDATRLISRGTPRSQRGIASFDSNAGQGLMQAGKAMGQVGAEIEIRAKEEKAKQDKILAGQSMLTAIKANYDFIEKAKNNPSGYQSFSDEYSKVYKSTKESVLGGIQDPYQKELMSQALEELALKTHSEISSLSRGFKKDHVNAYALQEENSIKQMAATNPEMAKAAMLSYNAYLDGNSDVFMADVATQRKLALANEVRVATQKRAETLWENTPDEEKLRVVSAPAKIANFNADTVKPYDAKRIADIKARVAAPSEYDALFQEMGEKYGVDPQELKLRAVVESGLNPTAQAAATPYGQSGGLMQLEAETAKRLGVTDRNDPRQSVEGAAKLLAQHQKAAGGDQSKVDKLYYAGSEKMIGPNTEQYAANLAAVRGGIQDPVFNSMSLEAQAKWLAPDQQKKIVENIAVNELSANPQAFIAKLDAGGYDVHFQVADKLKYKEMAIKVMDSQAENAKKTRYAQKVVANDGLYQKVLNNDPSALDEIAKYRDSAKTPEEIEYADNLRASFLKVNPMSPEDKVANFDILSSRYVELKKQAEEGNVNLADIVRFQEDVITNSLRGVPQLDGLIKKISQVVAMESEKTDGDKWFWQASDPYDAGYEFVDSFVKSNNLPLSTKVRMHQDFIRMADKLPEGVRNDQDALDAQLNVIAKNVAAKYGNKTTPLLRTLDDTPNGVVKADGTVEQLGSFDTTVNADAKVDDLEIKIATDSNGNKARVYYKDGKRVKAEILNADGTVASERLF